MVNYPAVCGRIAVKPPHPDLSNVRSTAKHFPTSLPRFYFAKPKGNQGLFSQIALPIRGLRSD